MSSGLALVNGFPRTQTFTVSLPSIYDSSVTIVVSGGNGTTTLNGPITSGTAITLPASGTYTLNGSNIPNLQVYLNGDRQEQTFDWITSGTGPNYTAIKFTYDLVVGDRVDLVIERAS